MDVFPTLLAPMKAIVSFGLDVAALASLKQPGAITSISMHSIKSNVDI